MPRSPVKVNRRFRGTYRLHLQGRSVSETSNHHEGMSNQMCLTLSSDLETVVSTPAPRVLLESKQSLSAREKVMANKLVI
jgi:hypothetical protein